METLRELIQTIIVIVILAVLIEMLLPGNDMRRYIKMVMGLMIIMAVLQTVAGVMNASFLQTVPAITVSETAAPSLEDIVAAGEQLAEQDRESALEQFSSGLSGQVLALTGMNATVQAVEASVTLDSDKNEIEKISIVFGPKGDENMVAPVVVDLNMQGHQKDETLNNTITPAQQKAAAELSAMVAQFYNLQPHQVKYEFRQ